MHPDVFIESYGLYKGWSNNANELPEIVKFTTDIPVNGQSEFGMILHIKKSRGKKLTFRIDHPKWLKDGQIEAPFTGEVPIKNNDYKFFIGDHFWEPFEDRAGNWVITVWLDDKKCASKTFKAILE